MKKFYALLITIMLIFTLAACKVQETPSPTESPKPTRRIRTVTSGASDPTQAEAPTKENTPEPTPSETTEAEITPIKAVISIDFASEALLAQPDSYDEYIDSNDEYHVKVVFTTNTVVKEFSFLELRFVDFDENDHIVYEIVEGRYTAETLHPERPLVMDMVFWGSIPDRGISYLDENGERYYFSISLSGEDNTLLLTALV